VANTEDKKLAIDVIARVDKLEKAMARAKKVTGDSYKNIEKRTGTMVSRVNNQLASVGKNFATGFLGGFVAGGIAGIVSRLGDMAHGIAEVGDQARRAGVSVKAFQEWKFVAEQNRIGIDQMTDGLKELNLRADEFVQTGKGSAAESFMRLGYSAEELKKKLQDPSRLLLEIIDRLGKFDKAAQIRISDELFGGSAGERFVELLAQGEQGIKRTIDQAHELGAVMDDDVVAKAAELDRQFNQITTTVSTGLKTAIVESATALQDFINTFEGMWQRYEQRRNAANMGALAGSLAGTTAPPSSGPPETVTTPKTDRLPKAAWTPPTPPPGGFGSSGGSRKTAISEAERQAQAVRKLIDELQEELRLVGASDTEKEISNQLRRVGVDATSKEGQQIAQLVTQINAETEAREKAKEAAEKQKQAVDNLFDMAQDGILSMVDGSVKAEDAIKRLAAQLAIAAAQAALLGSGPLAGLFGGGSGFNPTPGGFAQMLGIPGFATGTRYAPGGMALVGERGPELVNLPRGAQVIPNSQLRAPQMPALAQAGGSGAVNVAYSPVFNVAQGADPKAIAELRQVVARQQAELPAHVVQAVRAAKKRNMKGL
jgi:hypothetical protein